MASSEITFRISYTTECIHAPIADYYGQIYELAILGVGLTVVGFYLGDSLDEVQQP